MAFQTPITIREALEAIRRQDYVLPAIQREFTWDADRVCGLFDSLMQGYPIGSFLFWRVDAEKSGDYKWYGFMKDFHRKKNRHCPVLDVPQGGLLAILDGQQRLTSLNIGLRGSYAEKEPRKWWDNPSAFPTKNLYLNLLAMAPENELGLKYDFRFLTPQKATETGDALRWFRVSEVYGLKEDFDAFVALQKMDLGNHLQAARTLHRLFAIVHKERVLPYFEETEQDLDKVLNIFIRVNSAGVPLSYSDLLLSIATAQWTELDARKEIYGLVDELNGTKGGFDLSKDLVLKAGLMLSDIPSVAFRVTNFKSENMKTLADNWRGIEAALRLTADLLTDFGFTRGTLSANSVVIPLAYYVYRRQLTDSYRTSGQYAADRDRVRGWVCRSLVKAGVWGSGLDTLLLALRSAIQGEGENGFPADALDATMAKLGKGLHFSEDELRDIADTSYGDKHVFAVLGLLFPFIDLKNHYHIDHIFPRSKFTAVQLKKAGVPDADVWAFQEKANRLGNLQLLDGTANKEKQASPPSQWLDGQFPSPESRASYCDRHLLGVVPTDMIGFEAFYEERRNRLLERLRQVLGVAKTPDGQDASDGSNGVAGAN